MKDLEELCANINKEWKCFTATEPELINEAHRIKNRLEADLTHLTRVLESVPVALPIKHVVFKDGGIWEVVDPVTGHVSTWKYPSEIEEITRDSAYERALETAIRLRKEWIEGKKER